MVVTDPALGDGMAANFQMLDKSPSWRLPTGVIAGLACAAGGFGATAGAQGRRGRGRRKFQDELFRVCFIDPDQCK
jgi:hypothetical protein